MVVRERVNGTKLADDLRHRDISKRVAQELAESMEPSEITDTIRGLITAEMMTKFGPQPDWGAREAGVKLYLNYTVGMPTQRSEIVSINLDGVEALRERAADSPALQSAVKRILAQKAAESGNPSPA